MRTMAQNVAHGRHHRQGAEPNQFSNFKDFLEIEPPIFKEAEEPLQVDEWLNMLKQKFCLLWVTEQIKVEYASHQLQGPTAFGGVITDPHCPRMLRSHGTSLWRLSRDITFP
jgi:hypothetical protein